MAAELLEIGVGGFGIEDGGGVKYTHFPMVLGLTMHARLREVLYIPQPNDPALAHKS